MRRRRDRTPHKSAKLHETSLQIFSKPEIKNGKIELRDIEGLTIENRIACGKAIPDGTLAELKACHVILKGPTTTPNAGDGMPNIESANVADASALDLYAKRTTGTCSGKGYRLDFLS